MVKMAKRTRAEVILEMRDSWEKCCAEHFVIKNRRTGGQSLFVWNRGQRKLAGVILEQWSSGKPIRVILLKARQFGGSTLFQSFLLWMGMFRKMIRALTVGDTDDNAKHLHSLSRLMFRHVDGDLKPKKSIDRMDQLFFANPDSKTSATKPGLNSGLFCETAGSLSRDQGLEGAVSFRRGETFDLLHLSEVAFWPDMKRLMQSLVRAVPKRAGTAIFLESTANLKGDPWYDECRRAQDGESEYTFVFVPWFEAEEYESAVPDVGLGELSGREKWLMEIHGVSEGQIQWRRETLREMHDDLSAFLREYPEDPESCFTVSGSGVFGGVLAQAEASIEEPRLVGDIVRVKDEIEILPRRDAELWIWEKPRAGERYVVAVDASEGLTKDADNAAAVVLDLFGRVVASWNGKEPPGVFASTVALLGEWYNWALMMPEANGPGLVVLEGLFEMGYPRIYQRRLVDGRPHTKVDRGGWVTTKQSRGILIAGIRSYLAEMKGEGCGVRDRRLVRELGTFVKKVGSSGGVRIEAAHGCTDDLVMAYGIALQGSHEFKPGKVVQIGYRVGREPRSPIQRIRYLNPDRDKQKGIRRVGVA